MSGSRTVNKTNISRTMLLKNIGLFTVLLPKVAAIPRMFYLTKQPVSSLSLHVKAILLYLDFEQAKEI
jgi:hypothetical protein